jgi:hypothetical protein
MKLFAHASKVALVSILAVAMVVSGCSQAWIDVAIQDIPVVLQIAVSILSIVQTARGVEDPAVVDLANSAAAQAKTDLETLKTLVADYQAAAAVDKPNLVGKIDAALAVAQQDLASVLTAFHVKNQNLQLTIATSVGLALSTLAAIQALIPAQAAKVSRVAAKPISPKELKRAFNSTVRKGGYAQFAIK